MRILILPASSEEGQKLIEEFRTKGHDVWISDSKTTENKVRNFIKVNPINFEALSLAFRIANPEEIHYICEPSLLRGFHVILASVRARKLVIYFKEENPLSEIAKIMSRYLRFEYETKFLNE